MANNCKEDQIRRDGTGQVQRFLPALQTSANLLDDRTPEDILVFAKHYAELVRFYEVDAPVELPDPKKQYGSSDNNNNLIYTWKEFFTNDIAVLIASIAQYKNKLDWLRQEFEDKRKKTDNEPNAENYKALFIGIIVHLTRINKWYTRSIADHPLKNELEIKINSTLTPALQKLIAFGKGYTVLNDGKLGLRNHYAIFKEAPWNIQYDEIHADTDIYAGKTRQNKISHAALYVDDIFLTVLKAYKDLTDRTEFYLKSAFENYPEHQPHMALFIAFIKLFGHAQKQLNSLTRTHLEFYYRDVLHLHERPAHPDAVFLIYELAKEASEYVLEEGTPLTAGKDGIGKELIYKTESELVINKAKVTELKTVFQDIETRANNDITTQLIKKIYVAPVAKSSDGLGMPFKDPETAWPALGYFKTDQPENLIGKSAEIGFAIASPQLFLAEGVRTIRITISRPGIDLEPLNHFLKIYLTGENDWLKINDVEDPDSSKPKNYFAAGNTIIIRIPASEPAIIAYDKKLHRGNYDTRYPIIRFLMDSSIYDLFKTIAITPDQIIISVEVEGVTTLTLSNDDAPIDLTKPFNPFTSTPKPNSGFFIGNKEVFSKKLTWVRLLLDRKIKDDAVSTSIFTKLTAIQAGIDSFSAAIDYLFRNQVFPLTYNSGEVITPLVPPEESEVDPIFLQINFDEPPNDTYDFDRVVGSQLLTDPSDIFRANLRLSLHYINNQEGNADARIADILTPKENNANTFAYFQILSILLELNAIRISYHSNQVFERGVEQYFHIYPFGLVETTLNDNLTDPENEFIINTSYLLPQFKFGADNENQTGQDQYRGNIYQQGTLYVGIENLVPPQNLSLLFKIAEGTAENNDDTPPTIHWSYLDNNRWRPLPVENIVSDSTYGLQTTGIILIDFPKEATTNNTLIAPGLRWLCASVDDRSDRIPKIIDVIAQANKAVFFDQQNDPEHYRNPLPANTIAKLVTKVPEVKLITQPFESFDRKMREEGQVFYARASERLRHKHRAISTWDYEHLVLQHFPWIYKVKCLSNTDPVCLCRHEDGNTTKPCCCAQVAPGHVLIVPVSNLRNKNAVDILKPRTGRRTLIQIEEYLKKLTSPFVHVHAKNPLFEEIKTSFKVKFHTGTDKGRYLRQLNDDIIKYLTPWAFDETKEVVFGGKVWASNVVNFIEELKYVDYITCFKMIHIISHCCEKNTSGDLPCTDLNRTDYSGADAAITDRFRSEIQASSSRAILTSVKKHCIELIDEPKEVDECNCS